jgi:hypothetical protein
MAWPTKTEDFAMTLNRRICGRANSTAAVIGGGALLWMAFWVAPYLYALSNLIQWR